MIGYVLAVPLAFTVAGALHFLLAPLRRSHVIARFVARVGIIGVFYVTFMSVMVGVAGPYAFAGQMRGGGWSTSPTSGRDMLGMGLAAGVIGALVWPAATRGRGRDDLEM